MKWIVSLFTLLSTIFSGCQKWNTIYEGEHNGTTFKYQSRSIKGFSTNRNEWRITYGRYTPVYMDAVHSDWGPPYSTDIYGKNTFVIKNDTIQYSHNNFNPSEKFKFSSMLYIPIKSPDDPTGLAYINLFEDNWALFDSLFTDSNTYGHSIILGYVIGQKDDFTKLFKGQVNGVPMQLRIENDGRVLYENDDKWAQPKYSGLSSMVIMPGKKIIMDTNSDALTIDAIKNLKDKQGNNPTDFFQFETIQNSDVR